MAKKASPRITQRASQKEKTKEDLYVRVPKPKNMDLGDVVESLFIPLTPAIGKKLEDFQVFRPSMTSFVWALPNALLFAVQQVPASRQKILRAEPLNAPVGPLARLRHRSRELADLAADEVVVEIPKVGDFRLKIDKDENDNVDLEMVGDEADVTFSLERGPVRLSFFLRSSVRTDKILAVSWLGWPEGKRDSTTVLRVASLALNTIRDLPPFRLLSGIELTHVPAMGTSMGAYATVQAPSPEFNIPLMLWQDNTETQQAELVADGVVAVKVDLDTAALNQPGLNILLTPKDDKLESFEKYRQAIKDAVTTYFLEKFGAEETRSIKEDIICGELSPGAVERITEVGGQINKIDSVPHQALIS